MRPNDQDIAKLAVEARTKLEEALATDDVARSKELEAESDKIFERYQTLKAQAEKYDRVTAAAAVQEERRALAVREDDNPDADFTPAEKIRRRQLMQRAVEHGRDSLKEDDYQLLFVRKGVHDRAFAQYARFGRHGLTGAEKNVLDEHTRAFGTSTSADSNAGYTVPEGFYAMVVGDMAAFGPMADVGYTRFVQTAMGNPLPVPTETGGAGEEASYVREGATITNKDLAFGQVDMGAYKYGVSRTLSNELLADTGVDLLGYLVETTARSFGRGFNKAFTTGANTNTNPVAGLLTVLLASTGRRDADTTLAANAQQVKTGATGKFRAVSDGASPGDAVIDLMHKLDPAYRGRLELMCNDAILGSLRKFKDNEERFLFWPSLQTGQPDTLYGHPLRINQALDVEATTGSPNLMVALDPESYLVRHAGGMRMRRGDEVLQATDQVLFTTLQRCDGAPVRPRGIAVLQGTQ